MRKLLLLALFLCVHWAARGQATFDYRYWFDGDDSQAKLLTSANEHWQEEIDVSQLDCMLHAFHFQARNEKGVWSAPHTAYFIKTPSRTEGRLYYWFDGDDKAEQAFSGGNAAAMLDVSKLCDGLHTLHFYYKDNAATNVSSTRSCLFYKLPKTVSLGNYELWVDNDRSTLQRGKFNGQPLVYDASALREGVHLLHTQVGNDVYSSASSQMFIKVPQTQGIDSLTCMLFVDGELYKQEAVATRNGLLHWELDAAGMTPGIHKLQVLTVTPSGAATGMRETYFYRTMTPQEFASMKCYYSVDGENHQSEAGLYKNGLFHFDLDLSSLADGLHQISFMMITENGITSKAGSAFFMKTPLGGNGITRYDYWLNDNEENAVRTHLEQRVDPLKLIQLLPVTSEPFRSSSFTFEVDKAGVPMLYARNDFHLRTIDAAGRITESSAAFTDYKVSRDLEDIEPIQSSQTFESPRNNAIRWFELEAEEGDSIAFRSSQATSIQVFSPSGKEVYAASGDKSIDYDGCHTWEKGTYYVGVHDVSGSQRNLTLDYIHLDKYDVVSQDVRVVGNGGPSTITFQGNGFSQLESVILNAEQGILADSITHISDSRLAVRFDFTEMPVGSYDLTFNFKEGTKTVAQCIKVEKARPITIKGNVTFASVYLRTTSNTYTIKLKNEGNMSVYDMNVPVCIYTKTSDDLIRVDVKGADLMQYFRKTISQPNLKQIEDLKEQNAPISGDKMFFVKSTDNDYIDGYPVLHMLQIPVTLRPGMEEELSISLKAASKAYLYVWYPEKLDNVASPSKVRADRRKSKERCTPFDHILNDRIRMCEGNKQLEDWGMDQAYNVEDCDNLVPNKNCPPPPGGGGSDPVNSIDPNDIYGYAAESGSKFMTPEVQNVNYRIEFENDPEFATASAHVVVVKDTLNARYFDLKSYRPTSVKIGDKVVTLDGEQRFVRTVDMRPSINAIAQVEGKYDSNKGIATWTFTSIDPMTMEPTDNVMQGFLPVNYDGTSGIGEVAFDVSFNGTFADGTEVPNRASIVFDGNDPILTPTWTNVVDAVKPHSCVKEVVSKCDTLVTIHFEGSDEGAGVWKHTLYVQYGKGSTWENVAETDSSAIDFRIYPGMEYAFCSLATDSAGNVEVKDLTAEASLNTCKMGDANSDDVVDALDAVLTISYYLGDKDTYINASAADMNADGKIDALDVVMMQEVYLSTTKKRPIRKRLKTRK